MKTRIFTVVILAMTALSLYAENPAWGNLKKIHFYHTGRQYEKAITYLNSLELKDSSSEDKKLIVGELLKFADFYSTQHKFELAKSFYQKIITIAPDQWFIYNKLEQLNRLQGKKLISLKNTINQFLMIFKNFNSSFMVVNTFFNVLFYSVLLVFFIFSVSLFIKYFKLASNDFLIINDFNLSSKRLLILLALLFWPILLLSGWIIYPFLLSGFLWVYLNDNEKKSLIYAILLITIVSFLFSFNKVLENNIKTDAFKSVQKVFKGRLFEREDYEKFDDELKVLLAKSYYELAGYDKALDIINSTHDDYQSELKYILLGNINYRLDNIGESIKFYREALSLNERNLVALNNITLMLLKSNNLNVFEQYVERFPQIDEHKHFVEDIVNADVPESFLWRRVVSAPEATFDLFLLVRAWLGQLLKLPLIYILVIFFLYIRYTRRIFSDLGNSTYCSKCSKIIKEASIHKSYKMCDECYQLFLIKDVIFLEAKILKENELKKKFRKKRVFTMLFSIFIPGLVLNAREKNRLFILLSCVFYFFLIFSLSGIFIFTDLYSFSPLFFHFIGFLAAILYLIINTFSLRGDDYGV